MKTKNSKFVLACYESENNVTSDDLPDAILRNVSNEIYSSLFLVYHINQSPYFLKTSLSQGLAFVFFLILLVFLSSLFDGFPRKIM